MMVVALWIQMSIINSYRVEPTPDIPSDALQLNEIKNLAAEVSGLWFLIAETTQEFFI